METLGMITQKPFPRIEERKAFDIVEVFKCVCSLLGCVFLQVGW